MSNIENTKSDMSRIEAVEALQALQMAVEILAEKYGEECYRSCTIDLNGFPGKIEEICACIQAESAGEDVWADDPY